MFFVSFMESTWNFKHFQKKTIVIANVFPKLQTVKKLVRPISEKRRSKHPSIVNMLKGNKHLWNLHESTLIIFSINLRENHLENISLIEIWDFRGVCQHIDCRLKVFVSGLWEFTSKTKNLFSVFYFIYGICINFWIFSIKKRSLKLMYFRN